MEPLQALVMGVVQGLGEFLPISSSGHLILVPWLFGWKDPGLTFDIALHMGTLLAVVAFFWRDWVDLVGGFARSLRSRRVVDDPAAKLFWLVAIASVPGAVIGALGESAAEGVLRSPAIIAGFMIAVAFLLIAAERFGAHQRALKDTRLSDALIIGLSQAIAICPGVSRSGITMSTGLFLGQTRESAARFSFLLSTPIIAGAGLYNLRHIVTGGLPADERLAFLIGFATAAVVGYLSIGVLLRFIQRYSLRAFAYYRFGFGALVIAVLLLRASG